MSQLPLRSRLSTSQASTTGAERPPVTDAEILGKWPTTYVHLISHECNVCAALAREYFPGRTLAITNKPISDDGYRTPDSGEGVLRSTWRARIVDTRVGGSVLLTGKGGISERGALFQLFLDLTGLIEDKSDRKSS